MKRKRLESQYSTTFVHDLVDEGLIHRLPTAYPLPFKVVTARIMREDQAHALLDMPCTERGKANGTQGETK